MLLSGAVLTGLVAFLNVLFLGTKMSLFSRSDGASRDARPGVC